MEHDARLVAGGQPDDPTDRAPVYFEVVDGVGRMVYRASALPGCQNELLAWRLGVTGRSTPEWLQARFDAGHDHEPLIMEKIRRTYGFLPYGFQDEVEMPVGETALLRGHIDGLDPAGNAPLITHVEGKALFQPTRMEWDDVVVIDAKALSQSSFEVWQRKGMAGFPHYCWQQAFYCFGLNASGVVMAVKNKNTDEMIVDYYKKDSTVLVPIVNVIGRILEIERLAADNAVFEYDCDNPRYPCPFFPSCKRPDSGDRVKVDDKATLERIAMAVRKRDKAMAEMDLLKGEIEDYNKEILDLFGGRVATGKTPDGTVSTYHATSSFVNWEEIAKALDISIEDAKEKFQGSRTSEKLSIRVTRPRS